MTDQLLVAEPQLAASWLRYGEVAAAALPRGPMRSSYEWFSSTIQTTCSYVVGGLSRQPQTGSGPALALSGWTAPLHATSADSTATSTSTRTWRMWISVAQAAMEPFSGT